MWNYVSCIRTEMCAESSGPRLTESLESSFQSTFIMRGMLNHVKSQQSSPSAGTVGGGLDMIRGNGLHVREKTVL